MSVSRRASFAAGIAAARRQKKNRNMNRDNIQEDAAEGPEDQEDTNHITVIPGGYPPPQEPGDSPGKKPQGQSSLGQNGDSHKKNFQRPKPKMQCEIRAFTKESLEKINLRTANLIRDYGFLPKRSAHIEDGAQLPMKFEPFPDELLGKPIEELDQFVYEKTFCTVSRRFQKPFLQRFSASSSLFILPPWNCLRKAAVYISVNQYFDYLVMLTILANCAFLAMTEPINEAEYVFLGIYTTEMIIKVLAKGFILNNYTYLRNPWNWLDFIVIASGYLTTFIDMGNLAGLRTFRVLRALKTVSIMPGLKTIINALLHSVKQLAEVMTLTVFCLMVFALFALQVYMGQLRNKCVLEVPVNTNWSSWVTNSSHWFYVNGEPELCGNASGARSCPHGFLCLGSIGENPNYGFTSFDNLLWSMLTTFQLITLDYWENVYNMVVATGGPIHVIFFTIVVFFGSFYLINLMLAVVAMSYEEEAELMNAEKAKELEEAAKNREHKEVADECTIRTNSPKFPQDGTDQGCGQCTNKKENHAGAAEKKSKKDKSYLVVKAGQAGAELKSVGIANDGVNHHQAKFNITVPLPSDKDRHLLSSSSASLHDNSLSEYSSHTHSGDSSVNDSGVVGDHDQDSLYDLAVNNMDGNIINCKEKLERKPSKIDIPFVVSIESSTDRNCSGCQTCCLDYQCWLKMQDVLYTVINDTFFDVIVTLCIILNTVFLAIEHHGMSEDLQYILDLGNKVFTTFFLFEAILKLAALSKEYFANGWNIFDLVIVVASLLDLGLESVDGISVMRGMRLMRVLKLAQSWTTMKVLLSIIISTLGALGNLTFILLIVIYIFAVLGMQLFGKDYTEENFQGSIPRWNFTDFFHSFMMIFRILCGEWIEPLWDCMRVQKNSSGNPTSCLAIFIPALVVGNFMVLNLFLALLLNNFNSDELKQRKEEVETSEKNAFTKKVDVVKNKITKARSNLRVKVGLSALDLEEKYPSNGSLLNQNGIKYCSEPELVLGKGPGSDGDHRSSSRACSEGMVGLRSDPDPEAEGYVNIDHGEQRPVRRGDTLERGGGGAKPRLGSDRALNRRSLSERDINDIYEVHSKMIRKIVNDDNGRTSKSLSFGSGSARETDKTETPVNSGPDPCLPEICDKVFCSCMDGTWLHGKWYFFRSVIHDIVDNPFFEWTVLLLIFASSLSLCFEDINLQDNEELKFILKIVNLVFAVLFTVEMILKWFAFGLNNYFSSVWTCLDFVIVLVSVLSLAVEGSSNLTAFRSLRTLRALRPLRAISRWQGMKIVVNALMYAIPSIFNVLLVCLVFWLIFSIMGVQFFGGKFYKCVDDDNVRLNITEVADKWECAAKNFSWVNSKITFDHATFEGWMEIMADAVDATEVDHQPEYEASLYNYFYFVIFIVCGSFFTLNLFIGVIIDNFNALKKKYEGGVLEMFLTESQKHYYTAMKKLGRKKPQKVIKRPQNPYHALFYDISVSRRFEIAIFVLIFLNMVSMGIEHFDQSRTVTFVLEICNALFTTIFSLEATVKIIGLRHHYFTTAWNLFDFVLVIASIVGIVMEDMMEDFPVSPTLLRVVRVFRIGRILRLIRAAKGIRKLLFALIVSLPALFNIGALLALITFIYAIIGMTIFGHVKHTGAIDDLVNFETFGRSMQLLFRLVTSAGWNDVLDPLMAQPPDCDPDYKDLPNGNCGFPFVSIIYFVSFIIINFMIVINMYIAIILENFNQAHQEEEIGIVEEDLEMFYGKWSKFDPHATQFITFNQMSDFIASLDPPLGIPKPNTLAIVSFDLPIAKGDKIHCLDVLHSLTKYTLGFVDDDSEEFAKLSEQMDEKFKKQFPTRKELEIVSSTREWKKLDTAARCIQKFFRLYIRQRTLGGIDERIDTTTQTRAEREKMGNVSPRSNPETDSRSLPPSDHFDTDNDLDVTGESVVDTPDTHPEAHNHHQQHQSDYHHQQYNHDQHVQEQYQRQTDVRAELHNYTRGPEGELVSHHRDNGGYRGQAESRDNTSAYHRPYSDPDYVRPEFGGRETSDDYQPSRGRGLIYQEAEEDPGDDPDHPHYHQYEDEVCLKCDNASLLRQRTTSDQASMPRGQQRKQLEAEHVSPRASGYMTSSPRVSRNFQSEGCEYNYPGSGSGQEHHHPPTHPIYHPPPPHVTHVSYPGYPTVSVQDYTSTRGYDDLHHQTPYFPPPPRSHVPLRLPHPSAAARRQLPPPPRFAGGPPRYFRPPFPTARPPRPPIEVQMRHSEYGPIRRPVSELSPRQFYVQIPPRQPDPNSLPRRRLPEIPQQRRLPDTLPRTSRPSYTAGDDPYHLDPHYQDQSSHHMAPEQTPAETKTNPIRQPDSRVENRSPKKSPNTKHDDIKTRGVHSHDRDRDRHTRQESRNNSKQSKPSSRSPNRQAKTVSMTEDGGSTSKSRMGHSRTKSDVTTSGVLRGSGGSSGGGNRTGGARSKSHRHRVRRQSPVEERLSVHESDSMSDAFDDEGLFQIDENFAKFLDDKTSCQK